MTLIAALLDTARPPQSPSGWPPPPGPATAAWVSLDTADNDPVRLWTRHCHGPRPSRLRVIARDIAGFVAAGSHDMLTAVLPKIISGMAGLDSGVTLLIDDFHIVRATACHAQMDFLIKPSAGARSCGVDYPGRSHASA